MNKITLRHGDIPLYEVAEHTFTNPEKHDGKFKIALGEHSGHFHQIESRPEDLVIEKRGDGYVFLLKSEARLTHQEHKTLVLPPGLYQSGAQREVDHFSESVVRQVID